MRKENIKKNVKLALLLIMVLSMMTGCASQNESGEKDDVGAPETGLKVVLENEEPTVEKVPSKTEYHINAYANLGEEEAYRIKNELEAENTDSKQVTVTLQPFTAEAVGEQHEHALFRTKEEAEKQANSLKESYEKDGFDVKCEITQKEYTVSVNQKRKYNGKKRETVESYRGLTEDARNKKISESRGSIEQLVDVRITPSEEFKDTVITERLVTETTDPKKTEELIEKDKEKKNEKYSALGYDVRFADITISRPVLTGTVEEFSSEEIYNDRFEFDSDQEAREFAGKLEHNSKYAKVTTEIRKEKGKFVLYETITDYIYESKEETETRYIEYSYMVASKSDKEIKYDVDVVTTDYAFDYSEDEDTKIYFAFDIFAERKQQTRYNINVEVKTFD